MKLWILRHARAEHHSETGRDIDRSLDERGFLACRHLNRWLRETPHALPKQARVSPALRTQQTAQQSFKGLSVDYVLENGLWLASYQDLLEQIEAARSEGELLLVGHNPGLEELILRLGGLLPVPGLKPGTLVIMDLLDQPPAQLLEVVPPKETT